MRCESTVGNNNILNIKIVQIISIVYSQIPFPLGQYGYNSYCLIGRQNDYTKVIIPVGRLFDKVFIAYEMIIICYLPHSVQVSCEIHDVKLVRRGAAPTVT